MTTKLASLSQLLSAAEQGGYAVGAFSARHTPFVSAIVQAAERLRSPVLVQIAQVELGWYKTDLAHFAAQFWQQYQRLQPTVPVGLHLDHTQDFELIRQAIDLGFTSVMIDASALPLSENIAATRRVVEYAHPFGVSVEAELGRIGTADFIESDHDEELFTDPAEAAIFVRETGVEALAVSVGTAHGVYTVRQPRIDCERLTAIRQVTPVHLVLHGGSGTPAALIAGALAIPGGGISKINIATDLELAFLGALGRSGRLTEAEALALPADQQARGLQAVGAVVGEKIVHFLRSQQRCL